MATVVAAAASKIGLVESKTTDAGRFRSPSAALLPPAVPTISAAGGTAQGKPHARAAPPFEGGEAAEEDAVEAAAVAAAAGTSSPADAPTTRSDGIMPS